MRILKFIADVNVEKAVVDFLRAEGYDVKWIADFAVQCVMKTF